MASSGLTRYGDVNEARARERQIDFPFVSLSLNTAQNVLICTGTKRAPHGHRGSSKGRRSPEELQEAHAGSKPTSGTPRAQTPQTRGGTTACGTVENKLNNPGISLRYSRRLAHQGPFLHTASSLIARPPPFPTARQGPEPTTIPRQTRPRHDSPPPVGSRTPPSAAQPPALSPPHAPGPAATAFPRSQPTGPISGRGGRARSQLTGHASQSQRGKRARHASAL